MNSRTRVPLSLSRLMKVFSISLPPPSAGAFPLRTFELFCNFMCRFDWRLFCGPVLSKWLSEMLAQRNKFPYYLSAISNIPSVLFVISLFSSLSAHMVSVQTASFFFIDLKFPPLFNVSWTCCWMSAVVLFLINWDYSADSTRSILVGAVIYFCVFLCRCFPRHFTSFTHRFLHLPQPALILWLSSSGCRSVHQRYFLFLPLRLHSCSSTLFFIGCKLSVFLLDSFILPFFRTSFVVPLNRSVIIALDLA